MQPTSWKPMLISLYVGSGLTFLVTAIRDLVVIGLVDVTNQQVFFLFFNAINFAALLPGTVVATLGRAELSASVATVLVMFALFTGMAIAQTLPYPSVLVTTAAVLLCVAITFPVRMLTLNNALFMARVVPASTAICFVALLALRNEPQGLAVNYVCALVVTLGLAYWLVLRATGNANYPFYSDRKLGVQHGRRALMLLMMMVTANLGTLHFYGWQHVLLQSDIAFTQRGIFMLRIASYAYSFLSLPVVIVVATGFRFHKLNRLIWIAMGLLVATTAFAFSDVWPLVVVGGLTVTSVFLVYLSRELTGRIVHSF